MDRIRRNQGAPPLDDFRKCSSARKLFEFLGRAFPVKVNKQRTLNSFVIWLIERLIDKDVSDPSSAKSELKEWYQLLKSCRIDGQTIIDGYVQLEQDHVSKHPLDARRLHMFEQELRALMKILVPSSQALGQTLPVHDPSTSALVKAADCYTHPDRSLSVQKAPNSSRASSKSMDDYIHPERRVSIPTVVVSSVTAPSKSMDDYIHPGRRVSVPPARNGSTTTLGAGMSDYIHPGRRDLVSTAHESSKHAFSTSVLAHMPPDSVPSTSIAHSFSPAPEVMYGHMHPDRMEVSRNAAPEPGELVEGDVHLMEGNRTGTGRQGKSNNFDGSWLDMPFLSGANTIVLEAFVKEEEALGKEKEPDLSFLTGSNRMVFDDDWALVRKRKKAMQTEPTLDCSESPIDIGDANPNAKDGKESTVPENYVCNRCNVRGHRIQDCPTNGDKRFAVKAPEDYVCVKCGKQADHYVADCPQRPSRGSRNLQVEVERSPPRRVVSDSYRPETRAHKRHYSGDSDIMEVDSSAWRSRSRRKRGRGSRREDDEVDSAFSIRGKAGTNNRHWGESAHVVLSYVDPDKPAGNENPPRVYTKRKHLPVSPDPREEGRLSYYDVPSEEVKSKKSLSERVTLPRKTKRVVPKIERLPIRVASAPPRIRVDIREVSQMIDEEKIKDDLIPSFFKLFLDKELHRRAKGKRPVATDLIEMPSESEEGDDDAMDVDQGPGFVKREHGNHSLLEIPVGESAHRANASVIQHLHGVIDVDDDVAMMEARPSIIVSGLGDTTDLTELSNGDFQSDIVVVDD